MKVMAGAFKNRDVLVSTLVLAPLFAFAFFRSNPAEDAVILYEYAKNLAARGVITYGGAQHPIEGATDFLWMIGIAAFKAAGVDEYFSALLLNLLGAVFLVNAVPDVRYKILALGALLLTPYLYASLNGFSALFFSAAYVFALAQAMRNSRGFYGSILFLCLVRPDGVVWGAGLVLLKLVDHWESTDLQRDFKQALKWLVLPGLSYFAARAWYFGEWLPLPFLVKSSGDRNLLIFYSASLRSMAPVILPIALAAIASGRPILVRRLCCVCALPLLFYGALRLEQNVGNRFLAPMFFGALFLVGRTESPRALGVLVVASMYLGAFVAWNTLGTIRNSRSENVFYIAKELSGMQGKMLVTEAGRLAYYSNWTVHDSWGLNTPRFAHKPISASDLSEQDDYDLVVGHCDLSLLRDNASLEPVGGRSWMNQCKALVQYTRRQDYRLYLVPYHRAGNRAVALRPLVASSSSGATAPQCSRHDIYAINPKYADAVRLQRTLVNNGAIAYSPQLPTGGGDLLCSP